MDIIALTNARKQIITRIAQIDSYIENAEKSSSLAWAQIEAIEANPLTKEEDLIFTYDLYESCLNLIEKMESEKEQAIEAVQALNYLIEYYKNY